MLTTHVADLAKTFFVDEWDVVTPTTSYINRICDCINAATALADGWDWDKEGRQYWLLKVYGPIAFDNYWSYFHNQWM